jgi:hypothetical protein
MEITVDIEQDKKIRDTLAQSDAFKSILNNPRYTKVYDPIMNLDQDYYIKRNMYGVVRVKHDYSRGKERIHINIVKRMKVKPYKFNLNEFAIMIGILSEYQISYEDQGGAIEITFYNKKYFDDKWGKWSSDTEKNIDVMELILRMRKFK